MSSLKLSLADIPSLTGKRVIISGASSGIGLATAKLFAKKGAWVLNLDINPPKADPSNNSDNIEYRNCDVTKWDQLVSGFQHAGAIDMAIANAGVLETSNFLADDIDLSKDSVSISEPNYRILDINIRATMNFAKLAISSFRGSKRDGSVVLLSSSVGYWSDQSVPVYSATKAAVLGFARALRCSLRTSSGPNITVNTVAPGPTITAMVPLEAAAAIIEAGIPVSNSDHVALAVAYSAVATQDRPVELYGKDYTAHKELLESGNSSSEAGATFSRWNGRGILTLGDTFVEVEGLLTKLRPQWFGEQNEHWTRVQQAAMDMRDI